MKNYRKIELGFGDITSAIEKLKPFKESGELVYGEFNGKKLYSDIDDLNSAYLKITGKTKEECDELDRVWQEEYQAEKKKHEDSIPELTKHWIEKGNIILDEKYRDEWAKCVPIRLDDLYRGMELGATLDIVLELNNNCTLEKAKEIIDNQGHSGMSYSLVCLMVKSFCERGNEFYSFVK